VSALEPVRPPDPSAPGRPNLPIAPGLAVRVTIIGAVALALFAIIFFRLWYLQILTGEKYVKEASQTFERVFPLPAPRGEILDREHKPLTISRPTDEVLIDPAKLPTVGPQRSALYRRLGHLIGMRPKEIRELISHGHRELPWAPVVIKTNAGRAALVELSERQNQFPGVLQEQVSLRSYPYGDLAAQVVGYTGRINERELKRPGFKGVEQNAVVGQGGLEYFYDHDLRGTPGAQHIEVTAAGQPQPGARELKRVEPKAGYNLVTSLDVGLQQETERALAGEIHGGTGVGGAAVAMNPETGEIYAMASYPTFNPNEFDHELTKRQYENLAGTCNGCSPTMVNKATESVYPTGSAFKPIIAMGALEAGVISTETAMGAGTCVAVGNECRHNAGGVEDGNRNVTQALEVSEDTFFYLVGVDANGGLSLQHEAHRLGIGDPIHLDLPGESVGTVPDAKTVARLARLQGQCEARQARRRRHHRHTEACEIAEPGVVWTVGDDANLAVGQGELQTTPMQMAVAYSTLANAYRHAGHGRRVTPHFALAVEEPRGGVVEALTYPSKPVNMNGADLEAVMTGIHDATVGPGGTSTDVWTGWDEEKYPTFGKTGTAERIGHKEQSWYMCYLASPTRPIVIAVTVEEGGFGDEAAAPIARLMAAKWFSQREVFVKGSNPDM
jgi:penicillin-binding protein 2